MPMSLLEWMVRTTMLVLAGLVTLAILGSIHAMSTEAGSPGGFATEPGVAPAPAPSEQEREAAPAEQRAPGSSEGRVEGAGASGTIVASAPPPAERTQRWLEAIAYALLGLAGLFAIALILLWQLLRQLRRVADSAERSRFPPEPGRAINADRA